MPDMHMAGMPELRALPQHRLGPAVVSGVAGGMVEVTVDGCPLPATLAVPGIYTPAVGDTVLLIDAGDAAYVIGVLSASGPMTVAAPGDLRLLAPNGSITLAASAVNVTAGEVTLNARILALTAERLRESYRNVRRLVSGLLELDAGALRARVTETFSLLARRLRANAEEDVKIDGEKIHLG